MRSTLLTTELCPQVVYGVGEVPGPPHLSLAGLAFWPSLLAPENTANPISTLVTELSLPRGLPARNALACEPGGLVRS